MANDARLNPNRSKTKEQLIQELEDRLRLNRGQFSNLASETGSNQPYKLPQGRKVQDPTGMGFQNPSLNFQIPQAPSIPQIPQQSQPTESGAVLGASDMLPENPTAEQMLQAIFTAAWEPQLPSSEELEVRYQQTGEAYPIASQQDGSVLYNDGSVQAPSTEAPMPIASMADGTVLWSDGFVRERPPEGLAGYLAGVSGLSQFIFGQDQTVTQEYGNYNPALEPGSGYNLGTDFRTRDLKQRNLVAPVSMRVVQILHDDGTQWGDRSGHQGYGNSVLVELPSGEMLRLSHLSSLGQFEVGQVLNPGDLIGVPGATGNTNGEHLDVEYYNLDGQIDNPNNFKANVQEYSVGNQIVGVSPYYSTPQQSTNPEAIQSQYTVSPQPESTISNITKPVTELAQSVASIPQKAGQVLGDTTQAVSDALQPMSPERQALGSIPEKAAQTVGLDAELGISETIKGEDPQQARISALSQQPKQTNPYRQLAGNVVERIGDTIGIPEGVISETIAGNTTKRTNQALANEFGGQTPEQVPGIRQNIFDIGKDLTKRASSAKDAVGEIAGSVIDTTKQAGQGLQEIGRQGIDTLENIFQKTPLAGIGEKRVVGEESPGGDQGGFNQNSLVNRKFFSASNDTRDPFFKSGESEKYKDFIKETPDDGALSLNVFGDNFYQDPGRISSVFGNTFMGKDASDKYRNYIREKFSGEEWDQGDVEKLISEIPSVIQGGFSLREPKKAPPKRMPTLGEYLAQGKTAAQYYAETGQQSTLDSIRSNPRLHFDDKSGSVAEVGSPQHPSHKAGPSQSYYNDYGRQMSVGPQQGVTNAINAAARGQTYVSPSGNRIYNYTPANANMTDAGTGLPVYGGAPRSFSQPIKTNIFTRSTNAIKNIFGR